MTKKQTKNISKFKKSQVKHITSKKNNRKDSDRVFLKLVIFLVLGFFWIKIKFNTIIIPIPVGLILGVCLINYNKLIIDRKIDYAVLLLAMLIGFWAPTGLYVSL